MSLVIASGVFRRAAIGGWWRGVFVGLIALMVTMIIGCREESAAMSEVGEYDFTAPRLQWRYLSRSGREEIDAGLEDAGEVYSWVLLHSSGTDSGSVADFDFHHRRVLDLEDGLAYHILIGNGDGMADGGIAFGPRWENRLPGAVLSDPEKERGAVSICLIGDFRVEPPSLAQLEALDEILDYLTGKLGVVRVVLRSEVEPVRRDSPGELFPLAALRLAHPD